MLDTSTLNPIITLSFPKTSSLLQFNTQNMLSCMPTITFGISPVDGPILEPMQTFNISDWEWIFPSGKLSQVGNCLNIELLTDYTLQ